jgi:hypothetical protein
MFNISKRRVNKGIKSVVLLGIFIGFSWIAFCAFILLPKFKIGKTDAQILPSRQQSSTLLAQSSNKLSKYQLLPGTNSPNRQYAVAWGIPGRTSNSSEIEPNDDLDKVENYLVNSKTNKIIITLRNCQYFPIGHKLRLHGSRQGGF